MKLLSHQGSANQNRNEVLQQIVSTDYGMGKLGPLYTAGGNVKWYNHFESIQPSNSTSR